MNRTRGDITATGRGSASGGERARRSRRGFTLLESLVGVTILGVVLLAMIAAVTTAQTMSFEGQKRILASIAADDFMTEVATLDPSEALLLDGRSEPVGEMETLDGERYPGSFWALGRETAVSTVTLQDGDLGAPVPGVMVEVWVFDGFGVELTRVRLFVPMGGV